MSPDLKPGLRHVQTIHVGPHLTVPYVSPAFSGFHDMPRVFATAFMVGFVEWACIEALRPYLAASEKTVGTHVNISHMAATPVGLTVTATVELLAVDGRKLTFKVSCHDGVDLIGEGRHERALIDAAKFMDRVQAKTARAKAA
jgi:fluoroacetyl-CoA thioesterase